MLIDNAVIMAAGRSARLMPLSDDKPKGLFTVRGEVLIERQIRQLQEAGVPHIYVVTGYKAEMFDYLSEKFHVTLLYNPEWSTRNNHASIMAAGDILGNTYICSSDNYFTINPFAREADESYYAAVYAEGPTKEWCMSEDEEGYISSVTIGGMNAWYMLGHAFWNADFSRRFLDILNHEYNLPETREKLWEGVFMLHLNELKMRIRRYDQGVINEFDTLKELQAFDHTYLKYT